MLITEQEARSRWCPMARILFEVVRGPTLAFGSVNRAIVNEEEKLTTCIASQCAMWRTTSQYAHRKMYVCDDVMATTEPARPENVPASWVFEAYDKDADPTDPNPAAWIEPDDEARLRVHGYCGLAGRPESLIEADKPQER